MRKPLLLSLLLSLNLLPISFMHAQDAPAPSSPTPAANPARTSAPCARESTPCSNPDASGVYRPGRGVVLPKVLNLQNASFTDEARKKRVSGTVLLGLIVDPDGKPRDIHVERSLADTVPAKDRSAAISLDRSAMKTAAQYTFEPGTFDGKPVPVAIKIEVSFHLY